MTNNTQRGRALPALTLVGFIAALVLVGAAGIVSHRYDSTIRESFVASDEAQKALVRLNELEHELNDAMSGARAYLLHSDSDQLRRYTNAARNATSLLRKVEEHPASNGQSTTERLATAAQERLRSLDGIVTLAHRGGHEAAVAAAGTAVSTQRELALEAAIDAERARLSEFHLVQRENVLRELQLAQTANWLAAIASLMVLLAFGGLMLRYLRERYQATEELRRLNASLEETVQQRTGALSDLSQHLLTVRDEERASVARDIHDEIGSELSALTLDLATLRTAVTSNKPVAEAIWARIDASLHEMTAAHRRIINALHPAVLEHLGLEAALRTVLDEVAHRHALVCSLTADGDLRELPSGVPIAVYRLVQEAVNNAVKHANATRLDVRLARSATKLAVTITDDGIGMESHAMTKGRLGLIGMRERAYRLGGSFNIGPGPAGRGTRIVADFSAPHCEEEPRTSSLYLAKGEQARSDCGRPIGLGQDIDGLHQGRAARFSRLIVDGARPSDAAIERTE